MRIEFRATYWRSKKAQNNGDLSKKIIGTLVAATSEHKENF